MWYDSLYRSRWFVYSQITLEATPLVRSVNTQPTRTIKTVVVVVVMGFNVRPTVFQLFADGAYMRQVIVLPHWNVPAVGTWQEHPTQSHYKLTPGRPAIVRSTHLSMPSVSKGAATSNFNDFGVSRPGIEPTTSRSRSRRSTYWAKRAELTYWIQTCYIYWTKKV